MYELDISRCQQAYNVIRDYFSLVTTISTFYRHFEIIHNRFDWLKEDSFNGYFRYNDAWCVKFVRSIFNSPMMNELPVDIMSV